MWSIRQLPLLLVRRYLPVVGLLLAFTFTFTPCAGQVTEQDSLFRHISREMSAGFSCHFTYAQGSSAISPCLGDNARELEQLDTFISLAISHPDLYISRIRLTGYCSVEGSHARNEALSYERVEGFYAYLREYYPRLYRYPHDQAWVGEDWDGLVRLVRKSRLNKREEALKIIRKVREYDKREALLQKLDSGRTWSYMNNELFPQLRRVELRLEYTATPQPETEPTTSTPMPERATSPQPKAGESEKSQAALSSYSNPLSFGSHRTLFEEGRGEAARSAMFTLKTNLLLFAGVQSDFRYTAPVANAALEYYINDRWSVEAGAMYSYWRYNANREFQGISGYRLEPRYRLSGIFQEQLGHSRLGVYLGVYGRLGDYDRRIDNGQLTIDKQRSALANYDAAQTTNYTGKYWDAGLSAGFTVNLVGGLGLEVGLRGGYVHSSPSSKYIREGDYNWFESSRKYRKVRVTDLNISLTYRIDN
jgi:hypothetical protein